MFVNTFVALLLLSAAPTPVVEATHFDKHVATVFLFVSTDCPIANGMAPEIARVHDAFAPKDVAFYRVYADATLSDEAITKHGKDFAFAMPAVRDPSLDLVRLTGATVTPEAVVYDREGQRRYRGRINNRYEGLGKYRQEATQHDLRDALDAVVGGREVKTPETKAVGCFLPEPSDLPPSEALKEPKNDDAKENR